MQHVLENELLGYCYAPLGETAGALACALTDEEAEAVRKILVELLASEAAEPGNSLVEVVPVEVPRGGDLKSIIYRDRGAGATQRIVSFGFRDAAVETALPLLGIAVTVFSGKWGGADWLKIAAVVKTLWAKLVVLKRPADAEAIDVLEAIVRVRAKKVTGNGAGYPTNAEIERELGATAEAVTRGLARLNRLGVIAAVQWGEQADDLKHPANTWKVRL